MVSVNAGIHGEDVALYLIDNNAVYDIAWTTNCNQTSALATSSDLGCNYGPTFAELTTDINNLGTI